MKPMASHSPAGYRFETNCEPGARRAREALQCPARREGTATLQARDHRLRSLDSPGELSLREARALTGTDHRLRDDEFFPQRVVSPAVTRLPAPSLVQTFQVRHSVLPTSIALDHP